MSLTYQDIVKANGAIGAWALVEASGTDFAPYIGGTHLTGGGGLSYLQAGPFPAAEALGLAVGAFLHLPFGVALAPPFTTQAWLNLASLAPPSYELLLRNGLTGSSGSGFFYDVSTHHIHWTGTSDIDSGVGLTIGWHLHSWTTSVNTDTRYYIDDQLVFSRPALIASPGATTTGFLSDGGADNSHVAGLVAFPAVYAIELTAPQVAATFIAATNPDAAIQFTLTGGGQLGASNQDLLNQILAAVRKTY